MAESHTRETPIFAEGSRIGVRLTIPAPMGSGQYDYRVGPGQVLRAGDLVRVPLGPRLVSGVVWGEGDGEVGEEKLREVSERLSVPGLAASVLDFVDWVARYTLTSPGRVLRMVLSQPDALEPPREVAHFLLSGDTAPKGFRMTPARQAVLDWLAQAPSETLLTAPELARKAEVGTSVVKGLAEAGLLSWRMRPAEDDLPVPDPARPGLALSDQQQPVAAELVRAVGEGFQTFLLDGVTGSGKTEVYLEAVAAALKDGRQVLVMLPEIALGAQMLARFRDRFGASPVAWHSDLTQKQRRQAWRAILTGEARVVVGARSALFLPFCDLGLIVVDEEHDASFKQEDGVIYNARDMAVVRARLAEAPVILASATPSLETLVNAEKGRYRHLHLTSRHGEATLPGIELVDMRAEGLRADEWIAPSVIEAVRETLSRGEQALLFINRRGYAPLTLCRACGHRMQCPSCSAWLVEHRRLARLQCHHCGFQAALPKNCPNCEAEGSMVACGPGVERLAEACAELFPEARRLMAASDTIHSPGQAREMVRRVEEGEVNLIIGTQIIAKGYHFPNLTLVGVIDGDLGLQGGDLRAAERTFQMLYQVAGRAGRSAAKGRVLIQTYAPDSAVMAALQAIDRDSFIDVEREAREAALMPPFGRLVGLIVSDVSEGRALDTARRLSRHAPRFDGIEVLGPAPAPLSLLRGRYRFRLLMKCRKDIAPQEPLRRWLATVKLAHQTRVQVDVDPYSFF
ncbi:MAG: primosomal protein N' [Magnetovibrionaceae bacterium]